MQGEGLGDGSVHMEIARVEFCSQSDPIGSSVLLNNCQSFSRLIEIFVCVKIIFR